MEKFMISITIIVCGAFAAATVYDVEPSYNDNFLSSSEQHQSFIATADSISEVAFFCGKKIVTGKYQFWMADSNGTQISLTVESDSAGLFQHKLVFATFNPKVYVRKGSKYRLVVAHNQDSLVNFYYNRSEYRSSEVERL